MTTPCPRCGASQPADAPDGPCPRCRGADSTDADTDATFTYTPPGRGRVIQALTETVGVMPRVLLHDTRDGEDEQPLVRPSSDEMPPEAQRSSRVQLLGEIARGGMGAILKGRDPDLGRDLAVKVLLEAHRDNPDLVRRFIEEAQIGGQLQHPGVVPVYELGTFGDSRPYFTMKLVKGRTLADLMASRDGPLDDIAKFLGIFEQIAQAVAYAHARGVIHRDLKPSNVMVGSFGEVQVMDWGLAKVLPKGGVSDDASAGKVVANETVIATARSGPDADGIDLSRAGSIMGTPSYMAPEQARGEVDRVDERADVFALGSILCEILTGQPAFLGRNSGEIQRKAALGDTADALTRLDASGADLDLIGLARHCLSREPEDRPANAATLAGRLTSYQSAVQRKLRDSERDRAVAEATAVEERKRRKLQVGLAAAVLALSTVGGLSFAFQLQQRQARAAVRAEALGEATTLRNLALARPDDLARWQSALASIRQAEGAVGRDDPETLRQLETLRVELQTGLDAAERDRTLLDRLVDIRAAKADDPNGTTSESAYAGAFRDAGLDLAKLHPGRVVELIKARPPSMATAIATALDNWAAVRRNDLNDAEGARRLADVASKADPDPWRISLRAALNEPDAARRKAALRDLAATARVDVLDAISLDLLGRALSGIKESAQAEAVLRRAQRRHPGDVWINHDLAEVLEGLDRKADAIRYYTAARSVRPETAHELGHALQKNGEDDEAVAVFQNLIQLRPKDGRHQACLGLVLRSLGRAAEADSTLDRAIATLRETIRLQPEDSTAYYNLGNALKSRGDLDGQLQTFREWARRSPKNAVAHDYLGDALKGQGKLDEAVESYGRAIQIAPEWSVARLDLGMILGQMARYDEAIASLREASRLDPGNAEPHYYIGMSLHGQKKPDEAVAELREALKINPTHPEALERLADVLTELRKPDEAIAVYRDAIRGRPGAALLHNKLGIILADRKELDKAIAEYREAVRLEPQWHGYRTNLGNALEAQGKLDEAVEVQREAVRLKPDYAETRVNLGSALQSQGKLDEAIAEYREAIRLKPDLPEARNNLGNVFRTQEKYDEALVQLREAIRLKPDLPQAHSNIGRTCLALGRNEEALAEFREAVRFRPGDADDHYYLGSALRNLGKKEEAIAAYRESIRLNPLDFSPRHGLGEILEDSPETREEALREFREADRLSPNNSDFQAHIGNALRKLLRFDEAASTFRRAVTLPGLSPEEVEKFARLADEAERAGSLHRRLPGLVKGEDKAKDEAEALAFITLCYDTRHNATAVRVWEVSFAANPELAEDLERSHRYNAACSAALAASGQAKDSPADEPTRAGLRTRALDWLKADLDRYAGVVDTVTDEARAALARTLHHWRRDSDLEGIRDPEAVAKLPEGEREGWRAFWERVEALKKKAGSVSP
jgi:eukaryotic-like serine/threonine-protein kinase